MGGGGPMLWIARAHDAPGAEFTALDGPQTYHTMLNRVDRLDPRTLQHHGSYALALTRHFGNRPLAGPDAPRGRTWCSSPSPPAGWSAYPAAWAGPLALLVGLLGAGVVALGLRRGRLTWRGLAAGAAAFPLAAAAAVAAASVGLVGDQGARPRPPGLPDRRGLQRGRLPRRPGRAGGGGRVRPLRAARAVGAPRRSGRRRAALARPP